MSHAADQMLRAGERPTTRGVRAKIGAGSPNKIGPLLDRWASLSPRLDTGPAAFHRLPESVSHIAEALWVQALEEGRRRASIEQSHGERTNAQEKDRLELRSHILSLREGELVSRLQEKTDLINRLSEQTRTLELHVRKREADNSALAHRLTELVTQLSAQTVRRRLPRARIKPQRKSVLAKRTLKSTQVKKRSAGGTTKNSRKRRR